MPTADTAQFDERRVGERRRGGDRRVAAPSAADAERRRGPRRAILRRIVDRTSAAPEVFAIPLACPLCFGPLEHEAHLSWDSPGNYSVDTGYCPACSRRFFRTRDTGHYDSHSWAPLCPVCREPVSYAGRQAAGSMAYRCFLHADEEWLYEPSAQRWTRGREVPH